MRTTLVLGVAIGILGFAGRGDAAPIIGVTADTFSDGRGLLNDGAMPGEQQYGWVYVGNSGTTPLTVTGLEILNSVAGISFSDPNCGEGTSCSYAFTVPVNSGNGIAVKCNPSTPGIFTSTVVVASNAGGGANMATLVCKGFHTPVLTVTPAALDFGISHECWVGDSCGPLCNTQPYPQTLTITNTGPDPSELDLNIGLPPSGPNESFEIVGDPGYPVLRSGQSVQYTFYYHPRPPRQSDFVTLPIIPMYPDTVPPLEMPFSARHGYGMFRLETIPVLSGPIGQPIAGTITGRSFGESCITLAEQSLGSDIMTIDDPQIDNNHQRVLQANETLDWHITCTPRHVAMQCDTFNVAWWFDDGYLPLTMVCCQGDGGLLAPELSYVPFDDVPIGSPATRRIHVYNHGNQSTDLVALTSSDPHVTVAPVSGQLPITLAIGAETQIDVTFTPTDTTRIDATISLDGSIGDDATIDVAGQGIVVAIAAVPPAHDYGAVALPAAPLQTFELRNTGDRTLTVQSLALDLPSDYTIVGIAQGSTVDPGGTLTFSVVATPAALGRRSGSLAITFDRGAAVTIPLAAFASDPALVVVPADGTLAFGAVDVDVGPKIGHIQLHDAGTAAMTITGCAITGDAAFTVASGCPATIASGGDADIAIAFAPTAEADATAILTVTGTGFATSTLRIDLHGAGFDQHVALSAMTVGFPDTFRHPTAPATQTVTVRNTAATELALTAISVDGAGFSLVGPASATLAPNATADITVAFAPVSVAAYTGRLTLGNADDPAIATVALSGRGIARDLAIAPLAIDLGSVTVGTTAHSAVTIHNGDAAATFTIAQVTWTGDAAVQLAEPSQRTLAPGESATLDVVVAPTAPGAITGRIAVYADGDPDPIAEVTVDAQAVAVASSGGGCGCTTGDPAGLVLVLALAAFVLRRRR